MKLLYFVLLLAAFLSFSIAKTPRPFTLRTQMKVKDSEPKNDHFMQVSTSKDGKPVGIIVKRRGKLSKSKKRKPKEFPQESEEVLEIVGVRVPDTEDDRINVYRNAQVVNNKLIARKSFQFHEGGVIDEFHELV